MTDHELNTDNEPTVNIPLLRKAVEWVEAEEARPYREREWNQATWYLERSDTAQAEGWCGTACCVAGWVGLNSPDVAMERDEEGELTNRVTYHGGHSVHVADYARMQLGLTDAEADELFAGANAAADIRRIAEEIAGEAL